MLRDARFRQHRLNSKKIYNRKKYNIKKIIVKVRMSYADLRGHHGKKWNYEPGDYYMGRKKRK